MNREQMTIRLPCELMERLRREAEGKGSSFNGLVANILWKFVRYWEAG